jgi:hypothetical protein
MEKLITCEECGEEFEQNAEHECDPEELEEAKGLKLRIRRANAHNWVIERWRDAGIIERGPMKGQTRAAKWDTIKPLGYYPKLNNAAVALLDLEVANELEGEAWSGSDLSAALQAAEERVVKAARDAVRNAESPAAVESKAAPQWEMTPEQAQSILDAAEPSAQWLMIVGGRRFKRTSAETTQNLTPNQAAKARAEAILKG